MEGVWKIDVFKSMSRFISETITSSYLSSIVTMVISWYGQVTMEDEYEYSASGSDAHHNNQQSRPNIFYFSSVVTL